MPLLYFKYRTDQGNTITAAQVSPFSLGGNEAQLQTNFDIPAVQPYYLYYVNAGSILPNSDTTINTYLSSIGQFDTYTRYNLFTGYTATTAPSTFLSRTSFNTYSATTLTNINSRLLNTTFATYSANTLTAINNRLLTSAFNSYSATTLTNINSRLLNTTFATYSASTLTNINSRLLTSAFNSYSATTLTNINSRLLTSNFNTYSAATLTNINSRLLTSNFNTYSASTLSLIQASQAGLDPKQSVFVGTTANLSSATYNSSGGASGTGRFTSAPTTIDGIVLSNGKRVLVKNQTDARQNGIYAVISSGTWDRSSDMDGNPTTEISAGNFTFVETGATLTGSGWVIVGNGDLIVNTNPIVWTRYSSIAAYTQGTGILISGTIISFDGASVAGNSMTWGGTQLDVDPTTGTLLTALNTKLNVSLFNPYSASTLTNINSRLLTSAFNTYSATTATNINSRILTANNGLTKSGVNVRLGGNLTGATTIGLGVNSLTFTGTTGTLRYGSDLSAQYTNRSLVDRGFVTGLTSQRLLTTSFNTYSASTLTNINSRLLTSAFNTYSATTLTNINSRLLTNTYLIYTASTLTNINSRVLTTAFNTYSAATLTNINSRVLTTAFNTYSASTLTNINSRILTANNGLNKVGSNVRLGGNLTGATTIGLGVNSLTFTGTTGTLRYGSDLSAQYTIRSLVDRGFVTGLTSQRLLTTSFNTYSAATLTNINSRLLTTAFNTYSAVTQTQINNANVTYNNGINRVGNNVRLGGNLTGATTIGLGVNSLIFTGTTGTLRYGSDLSAQYTIRSLVDRGFVTGQTSLRLLTTSFNTYSASTLTNINSRLLTTAFNTYSAATLTNINSRLLTTAFNTYSASTLTNINSRLLTTAFNTYSASTLTNINSRLLTSAFNTYSASTLTNINSRILTANNGLTKSGVNVRLGGNLTGATTIGLGTSNLIFTGTTGTLRYGSDLSAQYTNRSLVDRGFVTGSTLYTRSQLVIYSSGSTNINTTLPVAIPFNVAPRVNDTATFTQTGGTIIRILVAGKYDISYSINVLNTTATAKSVAANIFRNGVIVNETLTSASFSSTNAGAQLVLTQTDITFAANDTISLAGYRLISATGNATIVPNSVFLNIVRKN
jgi:hypothetical protein